jgi:hypothetical protein
VTGDPGDGDLGDGLRSCPIGRHLGRKPCPLRVEEGDSPNPASTKRESGCPLLRSCSALGFGLSCDADFAERLGGAALADQASRRTVFGVVRMTCSVAAPRLDLDEIVVWQHS